MSTSYLHERDTVVSNDDANTDINQTKNTINDNNKHNINDDTFNNEAVKTSVEHSNNVASSTDNGDQ